MTLPSPQNLPPILLLLFLLAGGCSSGPEAAIRAHLGEFTETFNEGLGQDGLVALATARGIGDSFTEGVEISVPGWSRQTVGRDAVIGLAATTFQTVQEGSVDLSIDRIELQPGETGAVVTLRARAKVVGSGQSGERAFDLRLDYVLDEGWRIDRVVPSR